MTRKLTQLLMFVSLFMFVLLGSLVPAAANTFGTVYAMTNALGQNQILVYSRAKNGTLTLIQTIATGGGGSGTQLDATDSLGSQGSLILDAGHERLFAVNTETLASNGYDCQEGTITSFLVAHDGSLTFADKIASGGMYPNSLTLSKDVLYVLNAGGPGQDPACSGMNPNISGFRVDVHGNLKALADSLRPINPGPLDGTGYFLNCDPGGFPVPTFDCGLNPPAFPRSPGEVAYTPSGTQLVVTVKCINTIYVFPVNKNGTLGTPTLTQAAGPNQPTYFGFAFDEAGHMIVAEPFGGTATIPAGGAGTVSSFKIASNGDLTAISGSIANGQTTTCWIAIDPTSQYAYTTNNGSSTISNYSVASNGTLTLLAAAAATTPTLNRPNDMAIARQLVGSVHVSYLYALNAGSGTVAEFQINGDGSLTSLGTVSGLPANAGAQGLAAY